ncbi:hypothetical protein AK812_SmicGene40169 [Symbiodinium microadriaticum]|uniref:Uncharacterized protein n=1 Tax=Symbiodinium microadriaticum TaxID=2951 RepID=A0A1Q9C9D5_SYMMI|nr:hypothetical protein AK812_SmicGene40169 [Symbiodinium microadriaticum]
MESLEEFDLARELNFRTCMARLGRCFSSQSFEITRKGALPEFGLHRAGVGKRLQFTSTLTDADALLAS